MTAATCQGMIARRGLYNRFTCRFDLLNDLGSGTLAIYVAGPKAFRWKVLSIS